MILIIEYNSSEWILFRCEDESSLPRSILLTNLVQIWRPWAGIRSGATVSPDVFKVLYLEKHTEILCYYVLTKLVNGPLYGNTDSVRALEERPSCCRRHNTAARQLSLLQHATMYNRITSTKSPSVFMATFTNLTVLVPHSRDCSYYESRRILALPILRLQEHTALAHTISRTPWTWDIILP
jgi:hypothetical protein